MLKDIQVTLYDIFGYLLPGFVSLAGVAILFWALFMPAQPLVPVTSTLNWWVVAFIAYIVGHLVQATGNAVFRTKWFPSAEQQVLGEKGTLATNVVDRAKLAVSKLLEIPADTVNADFLYKVCDEVVAQIGNKEDRDIYIFREGFYRGMIISYILLFIGLFFRMVIPGAAVQVGKDTQPITAFMLFFGLVVALSGIGLSFIRYQRFGHYRVGQAVIGFLVLGKKTSLTQSRKLNHEPLHSDHF